MLANTALHYHHIVHRIATRADTALVRRTVYWFAQKDNVELVISFASSFSVCGFSNDSKRCAGAGRVGVLPAVAAWRLVLHGGLHPARAHHSRLL